MDKEDAVQESESVEITMYKHCLFCSKNVSTPVPGTLPADFYNETICRCLDLPHQPFLNLLGSQDLFYCDSCVQVLRDVKDLYMKLEEIHRQIDCLRKGVKNNILATRKYDRLEIVHHNHEKTTSFFSAMTIRKQIVDAVLQADVLNGATIAELDPYIRITPRGNQSASTHKMTLDTSDISVHPMSNHGNDHKFISIIPEEFIKCEVDLYEIGAADDSYHDHEEYDLEEGSAQDKDLDPLTKGQLISEIISGEKRLQVIVEKLQCPPSTAGRSVTLERKPLAGKGKFSSRRSRTKKNNQTTSNANVHNKINKIKAKNDLPCHIEGCDARFNTDLTRRSHMRKEHKDKWKPFKCDLCECSFPVKISLYTHSRTHNRQPDEVPFKCHCGASFRRKGDLARHNVVHHGSLKPTTLQCPTCPQICKTKQHFEEHARLHTGEKPFMCEVCSKDFIRRHDLLIHQRQHHAKELNLTEIQCQICSKRLSSLSYLRVHERLMHTGKDIPFNCDQCPFRSFGKAKFEMHQRVAHSNDYWFVCTVDGCTAKYKYKYLLARHMRKHNNERKYVCKECGKAFFELRHYQNHVGAIHHANSEELCAKNRCDICGQGFPIRKYLKRHLQKHRDGRLPPPPAAEHPTPS